MATIAMSYVLDGQKVFHFPYPVRVPGHVTLTVQGGGVVHHNDYEVIGIGPASTGVTVRWMGAPSDGSILVIARKVAAERVTDFKDDRPITASDLNAEFDNIYNILGQL